MIKINYLLLTGGEDGESREKKREKEAEKVA